MKRELTEAMRWPSFRRPFDCLYMLACVVFTGFVFVPEIFGNGKSKDYELWYWAGRQVLDGGPLYERSFAGMLDYIYPPVSAILLALPAALGKLPFYFLLSLLNALAWWVAGQISQMLAGADRIAPPWLEALPSFAVLVFVFDQFDLGQPTLVLLMLMLLGFLLMRRGWPIASGVMFALAAAIKVYPIAVLPYLAWRRQWRSIAGMLAGLVLLLVVLPAPIRGFDRNISELSKWYGAMVGSSSEAGFGQRPDQNWSWINQSVIAVTHRLLRPVDYIRDDKSPEYVNIANVSYDAANAAVLLVSAAIGLWFLMVMPGQSRTTPKSDAEEVAILLCLMTVASPLAREYYFVWLLFPFTVLTHRAAYDPRPHVRRWTWIAMGAALALMALTIPGFSRLWSALGNILAATLFLAATLGWHLRHPPDTFEANTVTKLAAPAPA